MTHDETASVELPGAPETESDGAVSSSELVRPRGRPRKPGLAIEWCHDIPDGVAQLAQRRTKDMLAHYGRNITAMPIETLVASCYLQGVEDCFAYHEKRPNDQAHPTAAESDGGAGGKESNGK